MCSSKTSSSSSSSRLQRSNSDITPTSLSHSHINGRPVLQPNCNRVPLLERRNSLKYSASIKSPLPSDAPIIVAKPATKPSAASPPLSPTLKSPRQPAVKRQPDPPHALNSSTDKILTPRCSTNYRPIVSVSVKKSKKCTPPTAAAAAPPPPVTVTTTPSLQKSSSLKYSSSAIVDAPGSIAAARREQVAIMQVQRKMRIAHYGRSKSAKYEVNFDISAAASTSTTVREDKRCSFITPNSDPIYVAYHDEEWGVPAHDDKLLFELLVLTSAQVGSDWTSVLKKRQDFRDAFAGFDAETVSKYTEKKINSVSADYGIELSQVRGVVDNSNRILEMKKEFGSFDKYLWGFVNEKPIATQYKLCQKIPVKTSKSESISKDMVRRGFRFVGPTVIHSFMQAAGLTNDHLTTCPRHLQCVALASQPQEAAAAAAI